MKINIQNEVPIQVTVCIAVDVLLAATYVLNGFLDQPLGAFLSYLFDLNSERNLPAWYSSVKLFLIAYLLLIHAMSRAEIRRNNALMLYLLASILAFMSFDEIVGIHERVGNASDILLPGQDRANSVFSATGIWMFVVLIPVFAFMLYLVQQLRSILLPLGAYWLFVAGLTIFMISAGGIEILANFATEVSSRLIQVVAEEFGEMIGATLMLWAVLNLSSSPERSAIA